MTEQELEIQSLKSLLGSAEVFLRQYEQFLRGKKRDMSESEKCRADAVQTLLNAILLRI